MELESSSPYPQEPATCPYPEPTPSSPHHPLQLPERNYMHLNKVMFVQLTFIGPCIANIFQYVSNKMQLYTVYLYLETSLHVSGVTSTHHQERIQLYLHHLVFVTP
jgi:hypothetical protein